MSMPSPFEMGQAVSANISGAFQKNREAAVMDQILAKAGSSPEADQIISQILTRMSPQMQQSAIQVINQRSESQKLNKQRNAYSSLGLDPAIADIDPSIAKEYIKGKTASSKNLSPFVKAQQDLEAKEYVALPEKINQYQEIISDLKEMRELTNKASSVLRGITDPEIRNRYNALRNKVSLNRAQLQKGAQSDKDMALILGETGDIGDIGGVKVFDRAIETATKNLGIANERGNQLYKKYEEQDATPIANNSIQPTVEQAKNSIFQNAPTREFVSVSGNKINVSASNNKQIISALSQGYAPSGYVAMMAPDGYPDAVPENDVQNELNKGSIIIYGD